MSATTETVHPPLTIEPFPLVNSTQVNSPTRNIEVIPAAPEQQPVVANLLELYIHDFGDFLDLELGEDGRFGYPNLPLYWHETNRHPLLIRVDGKLAGVVLIKQGSEVSSDPGVCDMAEFFIMRRYRRRGIGSLVAHEVWQKFPGRWEIRVMPSNHAARQFWEKAVTAFAGQAARTSRFKKNGESWHLFSF